MLGGFKNIVGDFPERNGDRNHQEVAHVFFAMTRFNLRSFSLQFLQTQILLSAGVTKQCLKQQRRPALTLNQLVIFSFSTNIFGVLDSRLAAWADRLVPAFTF